MKKNCEELAEKLNIHLIESEKKSCPEVKVNYSKVETEVNSLV